LVEKYETGKRKRAIMEDKKEERGKKNKNGEKKKRK
jgi:hypothetical protein